MSTSWLHANHWINYACPHPPASLMFVLDLSFSNQTGLDLP